MADMTTQGVSIAAADKSTISPRGNGDAGTKMTHIGGLSDADAMKFSGKSPAKKDDYENLLEDIERDFGGIGFDSEDKSQSFNSKKHSVNVNAQTRDQFEGDSFDPRTMGVKPGDDLTVQTMGMPKKSV